MMYPPPPPPPAPPSTPPPGYPPPAYPPRPSIFPSFSSLLTLNGFLHWDRMTGGQRAWLILAYVLFIGFLLPLHVFVYLAQLGLNVWGQERVRRGAAPGLAGGATGASGVLAGSSSGRVPATARASTALPGQTPPPPGRPRNYALGLGCAGLLVTCALCSGISAAAGGGGGNAGGAAGSLATGQSTGQVAQGQGGGGSSATAVPTETPTPRPTATPTPKPTATPAPLPTDTPIPNICTDAGCSPWGYSFEGSQLIYSPPGDFCAYFACIPSFWNNTNGYVEQCQDGDYSHSGGRSGSCSYHGGNKRPLYAH